MEDNRKHIIEAAQQYFSQTNMMKDNEEQLDEATFTPKNAKEMEKDHSALYKFVAGVLKDNNLKFKKDKGDIGKLAFGEVTFNIDIENSKKLSPKVKKALKANKKFVEFSNREQMYGNRPAEILYGTVRYKK